MSKAYTFNPVKQQEQKIDGMDAFNVRFNVKMKGLNHIGSTTFLQVDTVLLSFSYLEVEKNKNVSTASKEGDFNELIASIKGI